MKNDSISAASKIKELIDLHKSGKLSDEEYRDLLKLQIISQLKDHHTNELKKKKKPVKYSEEYIRVSPGKDKKYESDLLKSEFINHDEGQHIKENVQNILWVLLN